ICTDINPIAAFCTLETAVLNKVHIHPVITDLVTGLLPRLSGKVDLLLFNPPYVVTPSEEGGSVLLLAVALPLELSSWRVAAAAGREPSSEGRATSSSAEVRMAWYGSATLTSALLQAVRCLQSWVPDQRSLLSCCPALKAAQNLSALRCQRYSLLGSMVGMKIHWPKDKEKQDNPTGFETLT
ncbi:HemK methyltransferase family member 2, partial [Chelonia mydas]